MTTAAFCVCRGTYAKVAVLLYPSYQGKARLNINVKQHFNKLTDLLSDFQVIFRITGSVTVENAKTVIEDAVAMNPEVLMLVFCGHGRDNPQIGEHVRSQHGALRLSSGLLSEDDLVNALGGSFSGTLIRLLIMCSAAPAQAQPCNASQPVDADSTWGTQGQHPTAKCAFKAVNFFSSTKSQSFYEQDADKVLDAFVGAAGTKYAELRTNWPAGWVATETSQSSPFCTMAESYSGTFPGVARAGDVDCPPYT